MVALAAGGCAGGNNAAVTTGGSAGAVVDQVLDGDSLAVILDGERTEVRLLGINAPERGECYHQEAKQVLSDLIDDSEVFLSGEETDRFGRTLAYVATGSGVDVNLELVVAGAALAISADHPRRIQFKDAEETAFGQQLGRWRPGVCGELVAAAGVLIEEINYDAPGDDGFNRNGEWVMIANRGDGPVDLSGWRLADESSQHRFIFPPGSSLAAFSALYVYSGNGVNGEGSFYWDAADPVWSNGGDTAYLSDPAGNIVWRHAY
jgi:endonuclease YncB( thermonuclease family)